MIKECLALLCLALAAASSWKELDFVHTTAYTYGAANDNSGYVHYAYCGSEDRSSVLYLRRKVSNDEVRKTGFAVKGECRGAQVSVMGKRVYVAYQLVQPCACGAFACSNIYFKESFDSGGTWSEAVAVEVNSTVVTFNYNPLLVQDPYTGKVWLAYKSLHKENPTEIKVASKYPSRSEFAETVSVAVTNQSTIIPGGFAFARTENRSGSKLNVAWQTKSEESSYLHKIYSSYSNWKAKEWQKPLHIAETNLRDHDSPFALATDAHRLYLVVSRTDTISRGIWTLHSDDQGSTWSRPARISPAAYYLAVDAQLCTHKGKKRLYVLGQDQLLNKAGETMWYQDVETGRVERLGNPYGEDVSDCFSPRVLCGGSGVKILCKARVGKQKYKLLYRKINDMS